MTAPERYAFGYNGALSWDLHPDHQGEWVSYSDYATLAAEREEDRATHQTVVNAMNARLWELIREGNDLAARVRSLEGELREAIAFIESNVVPDSYSTAAREYIVRRFTAALSTPREETTNWRDDPKAVVEDDEPQIGRDYE